MPADFFRGRRSRPDLQRDGALVDVMVAVSVREEDRLAGAGRAAPAPVPLRVMVDSGASISTIPAGVCRALAIHPIGEILVEGYDGFHGRFDLAVLGP